eukprot:1127926-Rhodomonas_salina.1
MVWSSWKSEYSPSATMMMSSVILCSRRASRQCRQQYHTICTGQYNQQYQPICTVSTTRSVRVPSAHRVGRQYNAVAATDPNAHPSREDRLEGRISPGVARGLHAGP